ncbi:MAG: Asp-tRNA(Asn)/Glu-tRNA(Gln) amidotransferase subunit GatC [Patescibacteria group bacterium]
MSNKFSKQQIKHISQLAQIPISEKEADNLARDFTETLDVISNLQSIDTKNIEPTHQVTGLENILREDNVDEDRMLSQEEALSNASETHNGFFVVKHLLENKDA